MSYATVTDSRSSARECVSSSTNVNFKISSAHPDAALVFKCGDAAGLDGALGKMSRMIAHGEEKKMVVAGKEAALQYDWNKLSSRLVGFYGEL